MVPSAIRPTTSRGRPRRAARSAVVCAVGVGDQQAAGAFDEEEVAAPGERLGAVGEGAEVDAAPDRGRGQGGRRRQREARGGRRRRRDGRAGRAPEAARVRGLGVAAGLDGLERDRHQALAAGEAEQPGRDQRLADARVRAGDEQAAAAGRRRRHASSSARAAASRSTSPGSWAADRVMRRRDDPAGTVGGRMAGTKKPRARERRGHGQGPGLAAQHDRARSGRPAVRPRRPRPASASPSDRWRSASRARRRVALRAGDRARGRRRPRRRPAGGSAVVKMNVRARLTSRSRRARGAGDEPAGGAGRLAQGPDQDVGHDARGGAQPAAAGAEGAEGVGLVHDQDAVGRGGGIGQRARAGPTSPSMLNRDSVTRSRRRNWAPAASRRARGAGVAVGVDGDPGARQAAAVDEAGVVERRPRR